MSRFYEIDVADVADEIYADQVRDQMEYELRDRSVMCDWCGQTAYAPEKTLRKSGWYLGDGDEVCPDCD